MKDTHKMMESAIAANDVEKIRDIILEALHKDAGHASCLELVAMAIRETPNLFVDDDGLTPFLTSEYWTAYYAEKLEDACAANFSREKLLHYVDVMVELKHNSTGHHDRNAEKERDARAEELEIIAETFIEA